jgi:phosphate acyltransferase
MQREGPTVVAVDAMGGDHAPQAVVDGVLLLTAADQVRVLLVGQEGAIHSALRGRPLPTWVEVVPAPEVIGMDEAPSAARRKKDSSSLGVAARLVREGRAQAMMSAGNTGALMAVALLVVGRIPGVLRPAIAPLWPSRAEPVLVLDCGANADTKAEYLAQFAVMGSLYLEHVLERPQPRVGLLNIGTEQGKGNERVLAALPLLQAAPCRFVGSIEPADVLAGRVDVAVVEGFVGNMMLKTGEAVVELIFDSLRQGASRDLRSRLGAWLLRPVFRELKRNLDQGEHGGAPLLGLAGTVIKAHGSSQASTVASAVRAARRATQVDVVGRIAGSLAAIGQASREATDEPKL